MLTLFLAYNKNYYNTGILLIMHLASTKMEELMEQAGYKADLSPILEASYLTAQNVR